MPTMVTNHFLQRSTAMDAKFILRTDETVAAGAGGAGKGVVFIQDSVECYTAGRCKDLNDIFGANILYGAIERGEIFNFDGITEKIVKVIVCLNAT